MKTPPFLLFATLLFWGWLSDFLWVGAAMGALLELSRVIKFRWELDDTDFSRIWSFCVLLNIILIVYVFTNNDGQGLGGGAHGNRVIAAANAAEQTSIRFLRWLPMTTFPFLLAEVFNVRPSVPLTVISFLLRWRSRRQGDTSLPPNYAEVSYPFFFVCLFSAGIHANDGRLTYFFGAAILIFWALWMNRNQRFAWRVWLAVLTAVVALAFGEMAGIRAAQGALQNLNAKLLNWLVRSRTDPLRSMTSMGRIGQMKLSPKIIIRLQPHSPVEVPEYLREASYRGYRSDSSTWHAGGGRDFELLSAEADNTSWQLLSTNSSAASRVSIACYLRGSSRELGPFGVLPLPSGTARLENMPAYMILKTNRNITVLASGRGLVIFDALFGPKQSLAPPPDLDSTNSFDLTVPTNETATLKTIVAELNLPANATEAAKKRALEKFFEEHFTYSTWQGFDKLGDANGSPLTKFLLKSRTGHCEYFATASVLLLRQLGIPARYAVGYSVHEQRGTGYIVRERDAHAWCLAWNREKKIWEDYDTTPASWVRIESARTADEEWFSDIRSWIAFQFARFRWGQAEFQQYIFWSLIPLSFVLLGFILFRRRGKWHRTGDGKKTATIWPGLDSEFYLLEKKLAARGVPRQPGEVLSDWLERALAAPDLAALRAPLTELLRLHYAHRFDPAGLSAQQREQLKTDAAACLKQLTGK